MSDVKTNLIGLVNGAVSHGVDEVNVEFIIDFVQSISDTDGEREIALKWGEFYRKSWYLSEERSDRLAWAIMAIKECLNRTIDRELLEA